MFGKSPQLAWLLVGIVVAAVIVGGYLYNQGQLPTQRQAAVETESSPGAESQSDETAESVTEPDAGTPEAEPQMAEGEAAPPKFDVLRIEPDGSAVIAGVAPGTKVVELISDGVVIASTLATPNGDFVIALDKPLDPGAHELSLRGIREDGSEIVSSETGIVNVPEDKADADEVIAMVDREGVAPRILQRPESEEDTQTAEAPASEQQPTETAQN